MLYYLFEYLDRVLDFPGAGLFQYISFRSGVSIILSLLISIRFGKRIIRYLKRMQIGENVRALGLDGEESKGGTPTMGGLIILIAILVPVLLMCDLSNVYIQLVILATVWMGIIGFVDDYIKTFKKDKKGLKGKFKITGQVTLGLIVGLTLLFSDQVVVRMNYDQAMTKGYKIQSVKQTKYGKMAYVKSNITNLPFIKDNAFDYAQLLWFWKGKKGQAGAILFILAVIFIITAVSNGANLTDGLDGLLSGTSAIIGVTLGIFAYVSGNTIISDYLHILYLPNTAELVIFSAAFIGACVGFLWYNSYPATVFMGDTGSLMIGSVIAVVAIMLRKELLIPILCGIFFAESLSVILQVAYFKYTKKKYGEGRRIFLMSPLHHHYQKLGLHEAKIVTRFWIIQVLLAVITIITLKIR